MQDPDTRTDLVGSVACIDFPECNEAIVQNFIGQELKKGHGHCGFGNRLYTKST